MKYGTGWTKPRVKGTPLFAFRSLAAALNYVATTGGHNGEVWKCEARGVQTGIDSKQLHTVADQYLYSPRKLKVGWKDWETGKFAVRKSTWLFATEVKLVERVATV